MYEPERDNPEFVFLTSEDARVCTDKGEAAAADYMAHHVGHRKFKLTRVIGCSALGSASFTHYDFRPDAGNFFDDAPKGGDSR